MKNHNLISKPFQTFCLICLAYLYNSGCKKKKNVASINEGLEGGGRVSGFLLSVKKNNLKSLYLKLTFANRQDPDRIPKTNLSRDMRFPTMWYVQPAKAQNSLRICAV